MSPQPHEGPAEEGLTRSTLSPADHDDGARIYRELLSSFNHRCRNSLNGIKMSLYLFKRELGEAPPGTLRELERSYQRLELFFDWLQLMYRPLSLTVVRSPLGRFFDERLASWRSRFCVRGRTLELVPPPGDLSGDFDPMFMGMGLDAILEWRSEVCDPNTKTTLSWQIKDGSFEVRWEEARALNGFHLDERKPMFHHASCSDYPVDSLAHMLLKRIVSAHGGSLDTLYDPAFIMTLRWPHMHECRVNGVRIGEEHHGSNGAG